MQSPVLPSVYDGMTCLPILDIRILSGHGYYPKENDVRKRNCTALSGMREKNGSLGDSQTFLTLHSSFSALGKGEECCLLPRNVRKA